MVLDKFKKKESPEDFLELDSSHFSEQTHVNVRIESLNSYTDTDKIQTMLRDGSVVFLKIKKLREDDINELKRSVEKLRKTCTAMNGDMVGIDEDFLIITPNFAKVYRGKTI